MIFRLTSKDKSKYFYRPLTIILMLCFVFAVIVKYYCSYDLIMFLKIFFGTFAVQSFLFLVPLSIFQLNYFKKDKRTTLIIENNGESFAYQNNNAKVIFTEKNLEKVIFYLSPPLFDKRATWLY